MKKGRLISVLATFALLFVAFAPCEPAAANLIVDGIVSQVDETIYSNFLNYALFTHSGHNRGSGPEHDKARDNIYSTFKNFGLNTVWDPFDCGRADDCSYNVVATHTGTVYPNQMYIVGAHYDSVNNPGADDNASGVAGIMEAARVLSQYEFEKTIIFIAFDAEELGLRGSRDYARRHTDDDIRGMISMDMIAYNASGTNRARVYGRPTSATVKQRLREAISLYGNGLSSVDAGAIGRSDHDPFQDEGFQACLLIEYDVWDNPYYHGPLDSVDTEGYIDYAFATDMVRSVVGYLATEAVPIPEPATLVLLSFGALVLLRKRRSQAR
jgi:hypothetical protein